MHWYPISVSLLLVASWPSAIEASEDSATQWNYDQIAEYLAETATEENGEVFLGAIYNFFRGLTSSNNDRRQLRSNNLASPTVTQVGRTGTKPRFRYVLCTFYNTHGRMMRHCAALRNKRYDVGYYLLHGGS